MKGLRTGMFILFLLTQLMTPIQALDYIPSSDLHPLGSDNRFNLVVLQDLQGSGTVEGTLAVGGRLVTDDLFSVNESSTRTNEIALLIGGSADTADGDVNGKTAIAAQDVNDSYQLQNHTKNEDLSAVYETITLNNYFVTMRTDLSDRSDTLASNSSNGIITHTKQEYSFETVKNEPIAFYTLSGNSYQNCVFHFYPENNQQIILNFTASSVALNKVTIQLHEETAHSKLKQLTNILLFNFPSASTIVSTNSTLYGTFLAPRSSVTINGGSLSGQAVFSALSLSSSAAIRIGANSSSTYAIAIDTNQKATLTSPPNTAESLFSYILGSVFLLLLLLAIKMEKQKRYRQRRNHRI